MKNPSNYPIKSFARLKKITTLIFKKSVALIVNTVEYTWEKARERELKKSFIFEQKSI